MKTFAKISFITFTLAGGAFHALSADAIPNPGPAADATAPAGPRAGHPRQRAMMQRRAAMRNQMVKKLDLSADQISQLKAVRGETRSAIQAIRADTSLTQEQKKAKARETFQAAQEKMRGTLSAEQQEKLGKMRERLRQRLRAPL